MACVLKLQWFFILGKKIAKIGPLYDMDLKLKHGESGRMP
jgi:hypothetical protein